MGWSRASQYWPCIQRVSVGSKQASTDIKSIFYPIIRPSVRCGLGGNERYWIAIERFENECLIPGWVYGIRSFAIKTLELHGLLEDYPELDHSGLDVV